MKSLKADALLRTMPELPESIAARKRIRSRSRSSGRSEAHGGGSVLVDPVNPTPVPEKVLGRAEHTRALVGAPVAFSVNDNLLGAVGV